MQLRESTIARLGLVALALVEWRHAGLLVWDGTMPLHPFAIGLVLVLYLTSFAALLQALAKDEPTPSSLAWTVAPCVLVLVAFGWHDWLHKVQLDIYPTTDGHAYMDVAARQLLLGKNPYAESLVDGFRIFRLPMRYATPLLDGDFTDRVAYPSLSFLVLVPFALLHVPTYLAYAACFCVALYLILARAPWWVRGLLFAFFLHDETFALMTFGGVTDSVWALCLVGAALAWDRPVLRAVLVGLAASQKQHPWFFIPFLLVRVCREEGVKPWEGEARRFLVIIAGVFAALNVPFLLWGPKAFLVGLFEPLVAPMVQLSEGLTALGMTGYVRTPKPVTSIVFWALIAFTVWVYARHTARLRQWCWFLPAVVLWFGYRALMSYWYFNALLVVAAAVGPLGPALDEEKEASTALPVRIALAFAGTIVAVCVVFASTAEPFEVTVLSPVDTWETHAFRVRLRVTNRTKHTTKPRFVVQSNGIQPMQWTTDVGRPLQPGETDEFVARAPRPGNGFEVASGARIAVVDGDDGARAYATVAPDLTTMRFDAIPNGRFAYFDNRAGSPYAWVFNPGDDAVRLEVGASPADAARVTMVFDPNQGDAPSKDRCYPGQSIEKPALPAARTGDLATTIELPLDEVVAQVLVPETANRPPYTELYGLHLAVPGWQGYVLPGAPEPRGKLPSGEPFVSVDAPRGTFASVTFDLRKMLEDLGAPLELQRFQYMRFPDLDLPAHPVQVGWFASLPATGMGRVAFGSLLTKEGGLHEREIAARGVAERRTQQAWRAERELENDNNRHAVALARDVVAVEPTFDRLRLLGDVELRAGNPDRARDAYRRALEQRSTGAVEKGLGWALHWLKDDAGAVEHFQRAADLYLAEENKIPRVHRADAEHGLVTAYATLGKCEEAKAAAAAARVDNPFFPPPAPKPCFP